MNPSRDYTIDIVRGIAIVVMVGANMVPFLPEPYAWPLRYVSSIAAPIFICLSGTMLALAAKSKKKVQPFSYFVKRGLFLLATAAAIDVFAWHYVPFVGVDVLYLIAASLPFLYLAAKWNLERVLGLALAVFVATPILQFILGYAVEPLTPSLFEISSFGKTHFVQACKHWLIDGWFPIFPWFGYGLVGVVIGQWRWSFEGHIRFFNAKGPVILASFLVVSGAIFMQYLPGPLYARMGYSELFYPATLGFIALSIGAVLMLIALVDATRVATVWELLRPFGEASLFMYIAHSLVIGFCFEPLWPQMTTQTYLILCSTLLALLGVCGQLLRALRQNYRAMPTMLKWVVGG